MTWARWYWLAWGVLGFGVVEGVALATGHSENTLSAAIWHWCRVTPGDSWRTWTALHALMALFMVWLFVHLVLGYWAGGIHNPVVRAAFALPAHPWPFFGED